MWFQSNCPKILLQHEPRAVHSPATNQQQSYRINRFHTRGPGQPSARTRAPRPRPPPLGPVSCGGREWPGQGGARKRSSSPWDAHPDSGGQGGKGQTLRSQPVQASESWPGSWGHAGAEARSARVRLGLRRPQRALSTRTAPSRDRDRWGPCTLTARITCLPPKPPSLWGNMTWGAPSNAQGS